MAARSAPPVEVRLATPTSPIPLRKLRVGATMPVLAVAGTTTDLDPALAKALLPALKAAVAAVAEGGGAIVTGGTDAGVLHLLGLALASSSPAPKAVVGVGPDALLTPANEPAAPAPAAPARPAPAAPAAPTAPTEDDEAAGPAASGPEPSAEPAAAPAPAPIDAQLTALLRVPGAEWGDETPALSRVVADIAGQHPAVALLAGGGEGSRVELVEHLRRGRPVVVLAGSGRLADEIVAGTAADGDADLAALLAGGKVHLVELEDAPAVLGPLLAELLERRRRRKLRSRVALFSVLPTWRSPANRPRSPIPPTSAARYRELRDRIDAADKVVVPAFATCDAEAGAEQNRHRWFTVLAIVGGLLTTLAGAAQAWLQSVAWPSVLVATLGAGTSALITVSRRQDSLRRYLIARIRAERLRSLYFEYLAKEWEDGTTPPQQRHWLEEQVVRHQRGPVTL